MKPLLTFCQIQIVYIKLVFSGSETLVVQTLNRSLIYFLWVKIWLLIWGLFYFFILGSVAIKLLRFQWLGPNDWLLIKVEFMGTCQIVHWDITALLGKVAPRCLGGWKDLKSTNQCYLVFSFYTLAWTTRVKTAK
jgi:hypothetical protein